MPDEKIKTESYQQFGGINSKFSPYTLGPMEFLDLANLDFFTPGSLSERWGSTQYLGQTFAGPINSFFEFSKLDGTSHIIIGHSGGIWDGATTGNALGISFGTYGATQVSWAAVPGYNLAAAGANKIINLNTIGVQYPGGINGATAVYGNGETFNFDPVAQSDNTMSFAVLNNYLFMADGNKFLKFDGATTFPVGLPPVTYGATFGTFGSSTTSGTAASPFGITIVTSNLVGATNGIIIPAGASFGTYFFYASYVNNRGFEGPVWPIFILGANTTLNASLTHSATFFNLVAPVATPLAYGISAINLYCFYDPAIGSSNPFDGGFLSGATLGVNQIWLEPTPNLISTTAASGSTITNIFFGITGAGGLTGILTNTIGPLANTFGYQPLGETIGYGSTLGFRTLITNLTSPAGSGPNALTSYFPRFLETYQNRLFLAGFSMTPSTVWFSDTGEPEGYNPTFNFQVRTNDADYVTAMKAFVSKLYFFKKNSFHILTGDNPLNFFVQQISDQFGCLNNRCVVTVDNQLFFLDRKGVMTWDGSLQNISYKIQPVFDSMNYNVALTTACGMHDKLRNQIMFSIPINGSSTNNLTIVYDYMLKAWTKYNGVNIASFNPVQGRNVTKNAFYGDYSGRLNWFGSSFLSDNGAGFTTYLKTRFLHEIGDSSQKMYRRLYLNTDAPSATLTFGVNFFQDYGTSVVLGTTIVQGTFQNRIDYGVSARAIAFEMSNLQTTVPLRIHGFTIESVFLRKL